MTHDEVFGLSGRRVLITGATGGVGATLVRRFADAGALVLGCDLPGADFADLPVAERHGFDLSDSAAVHAAVSKILAAGVPDVVVSNAGWTRAESFRMLDDAALNRELDVNFTGTAILTSALLPAMRGRDGSAFVFVASVNALAHFGNPAYAAAKAALVAWARAIAAEEGRNGIRANVVAPGSIRTPAWAHRLDADPGLMARVAALYPLGRIVETEEVANAVLFLASRLASGITGVTLPVDAGIGAGNMPFLRLIDP